MDIHATNFSTNFGDVRPEWVTFCMYALHIHVDIEKALCIVAEIHLSSQVWESFEY